MFEAHTAVWLFIFPRANAGTVMVATTAVMAMLAKSSTSVNARVHEDTAGLDSDRLGKWTLLSQKKVVKATLKWFSLILVALSVGKPYKSPGPPLRESIFVHFLLISLGYHPDDSGGAFRYVTELAEGLVLRGHIVEVIVPGEGDCEKKICAGVTLHRVNVRPSIFWRHWRDRNQAVQKIVRQLRATDPNLLIVSCHAYFARAIADDPGPVVSLFTGPWAEEFLQSNALASKPLLREKFIAPMLRRIERSGLQRSLAIFTISHYYRQKLPTWHPSLSRPIHIIRGGVDLQHFHPSENRAKIRTQFGVADNEFIFLTVRRLEPRMGLSALIDAFKSIASNARLWIAGAGSQRQVLEEKIRAHNLAHRVQLLGFVPEAELPSRYAAADCTVMPSLDLEGFGLSTVESLACGVPVIGSRQGATPEILEPLNANLLYDPPDGLTAKLAEALNNPSMLPTREHCRQYAVERYPWDHTIDQFEQSCLAILNGGLP